MSENFTNLDKINLEELLKIENELNEERYKLKNRLCKINEIKAKIEEIKCEKCKHEFERIYQVYDRSYFICKICKYQTF